MADYEGSDCCHKYVFAHEAGHYLARFPYHTSQDGLLMTPGALGRRLLKFDEEIGVGSVAFRGSLSLPLSARLTSLGLYGTTSRYA
jgi:hypothetical protein